MHRFCFRSQHYLRLLHPRYVSSSSRKPIKPHNNVENAEIVPPQISHDLSPTSSSVSRTSPIFLVVSALFASIALLVSDHHRRRQSDDGETSNTTLYDAVDHAINNSGDSFKKVFHHVKQTGTAASVLWQSLNSVLSSANHEVRSGFEIRVAALLADIAAANSSRRAAIVGAGGGAVVDWLLESVTAAKDGGGTQAESARALAYLITDHNVSAAVLGRPHAIPNLLRFIFSCQPQRSKKVTLSISCSSFELQSSFCYV